ncbi:MAG TPA: FAD:protein FMN transferase [Sphingobium sp.]|jgi:thiamine biosynthesis lipoprotein|uniref:FAD:protein FMN transferase n=1 Tax=unclassified Sphingobium TaxID=2611147 RepID=UPI0007F3E1D6|nr:MULTISPECIES: FAD:protein FMN transferase [unclassified Sphingobium]OAN55404.1 thiamine biosynthesis protein ApbE [Sphingobium sp. TCM1]HAF41425.1 FAD:protein FMN transferase [Sphingobium sp.]
MGTSWSAQIVDPPEGCAAEIEKVLTGIIDQMSNWEANSAISRFNRLAVGEWMPLPADLLTVLRAGLDIARLSDGAFDPAIGRLVDRWGFGPDAESFDAAVIPSPWRRIEVDGTRARRTADVSLDFSGIAKGFAVDAIAVALRAMGVANFLVEIGGELRGDGIKPDIQPWWVDVEAPPGLPVPTLRIALSGLAVATSGDYRRYRMDRDRRLSHSIDPATGAPIAEGVASVTVLHDSAMLADALATAITILGPDRGMALATSHALAARLVLRTDAGAQEYMTPRLAAMLD